jgi:hypothetical protein
VHLLDVFAPDWDCTLNDLVHCFRSSHFRELSTPATSGSSIQLIGYAVPYHDRAGDTQHFQAPTPTARSDPKAQYTKSIGLSARHRDQTTPKAKEVSRQQLKTEQQHSRYPFSQRTYWVSVVAFCSFVLAALYWVVYLSSTQP